ncbi:GNAT family N-acetyltransferase [Streptomyces sp. NBC_01497]|uniref:GNAT family N-acetyltransferase n=1 Tax=Streptomyces sp. NBC_01497 TaxID=2903885 RepID=UPI002E363478|nr:GNAT family N-acetyltransferase [Streptomyces sp. NBC_01497]
MTDERDLSERAQELWAGLASGTASPVPAGSVPSPHAARVPSPPAAFGPAGSVRVVVAPSSLLCPPGWLGLVVIGGAGLVTAPDGERARAVRTAVAGGLTAGGLADAETVRRALPLRTGAVLGPAALAYVSEAAFRRPAGGTVAATACEEAEGLRELWSACTEEEIDESGLREITSPAFVVREGGGAGDRIVAAAGYRRWPGAAAHLCVLTAPAARGRGLARVSGAAAVAHALAAGLLPQWRARPVASRRVAAALGFRELGTQVSIEVAGPQGG